MSDQYESGPASLFASAARSPKVIVLHDGWCMCGVRTDQPEAFAAPCACGATIGHYHCKECGGVKACAHWVGGARWRAIHDTAKPAEDGVNG